MYKRQEDTILDRKFNNYLAAVHFTPKNEYGVAFLDISTGDFLVSEGDAATVEKLIDNFNPAEIIYSKFYQKQYQQTFHDRYYSYTLDEWVFSHDYGLSLIHI